MNKNTIDIQTITSESLRLKKYFDVFPEYYRLDKIVEKSLWHHNQTVLDHSIKVFSGLETVLKFENIESNKRKYFQKYLSDYVGKKSRKEILIVATLLHDIAKVDTQVTLPDGATRCLEHELIAAGRVFGFSSRFGISGKDEQYVERIVRYHGFVSGILSLMIANGKKEEYLKIFIETVGDIAIELVLLMKADLLGSDLEKNDAKAFNERVDLLSWMLQNI